MPWSEHMSIKKQQALFQQHSPVVQRALEEAGELLWGRCLGARKYQVSAGDGRWRLSEKGVRLYLRHRMAVGVELTVEIIGDSRFRLAFENVRPPCVSVIHYTADLSELQLREGALSICLDLIQENRVELDHIRPDVPVIPPKFQVSPLAQLAMMVIMVATLYTCAVNLVAWDSLVSRYGEISNRTPLERESRDQAPVHPRVKGRVTAIETGPGQSL